MKVSVIKSLRKGEWYYFTGWEDRQWDIDLYAAKQFQTTEEAGAFLTHAAKTKHWGGYFKVDEYFVFR
jgi:hypothetical protein